MDPGGYAWWYVDALSDDGTCGLTVIAFVGSVFSPYYAWARRRGPADPDDHCALNVALYQRSAKLWTMTERGSRWITRDDEHFAIGPSALAWNGGVLTIRIDEVAVPVPRRVRGTIRVRPETVLDQPMALDADGRHVWHPVSPRAHVAVDMQNPSWSWNGLGYLDGNSGSAPLEDAFADWTWSRVSLPDRTAVLYDVAERSGARTSLALELDLAGRLTEAAPPPVAPLAGTRWGLSRSTRSDCEPRLVRSLEDAPFYARASLATHWQGRPATVMHERLSLDRFRMPVVQMMLPFRMPRRP